MTTASKKRKSIKEWTMDDNDLAGFLSESRWELSQKEVSAVVEFLQQHNVTTIGGLKQNLVDSFDLGFVTKLLRFFGGYNTKFGQLTIALGNIQPSKDPEDILDKKILDQSGQPLNELQSKQAEFTKEAISVKGPPTGTKARNYDIRIVLGPSGSGKTVYAINYLASLNDQQPKTHEKGVCIYYSLSEHSSSMFTTNEAFVEAIKQVLHKALLKGSDEKWDAVKRLDMRVSLILDEAGALSDILDDFTLLLGVYEKINDCSLFPRLILAGTGYDKTPTGATSSNDIYKYRMQPWDENKLSRVAERKYPVNNDGRDFVAAIVQYPLLKRLITNARAAIFTLDAVKRLKTGHHTIKLQGSIGTVVQMVIGEYTAFNGIGMLSDSHWKVLAYAVFHELNHQNYIVKPRFPEFEKIKGSKLQKGEKDKIIRQAQGVVDLHVEASSVNGVEVCNFVDQEKQSISVTPAMSMLLYNLLGVDFTIYDNWEGLAATAALHAAYLEVLKNENTQSDGVQISRLTKSVPATGATRNIKIPHQPTTPTIFINGDKAPFCDVITKFRGIQAKYSKKVDYPLDLGTELQKCGLLEIKLSYALMTRDGVDPEEEQDIVSEDDLVETLDGHHVDVEAGNMKAKTKESKEKKGEKAFRMGNATMAAFVHSWKTAGEVMGHSNGGNIIEVKPKKFLSPAFGFPTTGRAEKEVVPSREYKVEVNGSVKFQNEEIAEAKFDANAPFEMIFITNAKQIRLFPKWEGNAIVIASDIVDASGEFQDKKKPNGYDEFLKQLNLKKHVNIKFVFTG